MSLRSDIPGWEGSIGPGPGQYARPHVYARDTGSGAGNCQCGADLGDWVHVQAAPGVAVPRGYRHGPLPAAYADTYRQLDADTSGGEAG